MTLDLKGLPTWWGSHSFLTCKVIQPCKAVSAVSTEENWRCVIPVDKRDPGPPRKVGSELVLKKSRMWKIKVSQSRAAH